MTETAQREARRLAAEYLTCHVYNICMAKMGLDEAVISLLEDEELLETADQPTRRRHPKISEEALAALGPELHKLLGLARDMRQSMDMVSGGNRAQHFLNAEAMHNPRAAISVAGEPVPANGPFRGMVIAAPVALALWAATIIACWMIFRA